MIVDIGRSQFAQWPRASLAEAMTVSIDVSPWQLREPGFAEEVLELLRAEGLQQLTTNSTPQCTKPVKARRRRRKESVNANHWPPSPDLASATWESSSFCC
jgi:hypothetical protein